MIQLRSSLFFRVWRLQWETNLLKIIYLKASELTLEDKRVTKEESLIMNYTDLNM